MKMEVRVYGKTKKQRIFFGALLGLLAIALAGSAWAWTRGGAQCESCGGARDIAGGHSLAPLGVSLYGGLLALGAFFGRSKILFSGLMLAASAHAVLFILLT